MARESSARHMNEIVTPVPESTATADAPDQGAIVIHGARQNNLKNLTVSIPIGELIVVAPPPARSETPNTRQIGDGWLEAFGDLLVRTKT
jgi:hypothetical protein